MTLPSERGKRAGLSVAHRTLLTAHLMGDRGTGVPLWTPGQRPLGEAEGSEDRGEVLVPASGDIGLLRQLRGERSPSPEAVRPGIAQELVGPEVQTLQVCTSWKALTKACFLSEFSAG